MTEEALTALAQRISDLGLGSDWAMDYETLDDLYQAIKVEERFRQQEATAEEEQLAIQERNNAMRHYRGAPTGTASEESMQTRAPETAGVQEDLLQMAESYWDFFCTHGGDEDWAMWETLESCFQGQEDLLDRLEETISQMTESDDWEQREDLPANWWLEASSWRNAGNSESGLTSSDLQGFRSLPAAMSNAVAAGAAKGVSGITVQLDGYTVGRLVAPYVSETIARDVII